MPRILSQPESPPTDNTFGVGAHHDFFRGDFEPRLAFLYARAILALFICEMVVAPQSSALLGRLFDENEKVTGLGATAAHIVWLVAHLKTHLFEKVDSSEHAVDFYRF